MLGPGTELRALSMSVGSPGSAKRAPGLGWCAAKPRRPVGPPGSGSGLLLGLGAAALRLGAYPTVVTLSVFVAGAGFPAQRRCEAVVGRGREAEAQAKRPCSELCPSGLVPGGAFTLASSLGLSCGPRVPTGHFQPLAVCWLPGSPSSSTRCWAPTHLTPGG